MRKAFLALMAMTMVLVLPAATASANHLPVTLEANGAIVGVAEDGALITAGTYQVLDLDGNIVDEGTSSGLSYVTPAGPYSGTVVYSGLVGDVLTKFQGEPVEAVVNDDGSTDILFKELQKITSADGFGARCSGYTLVTIHVDGSATFTTELSCNLRPTG